MILINIILGIINAVKQNDKENIWFSQNAVAGRIVFYGAIVVLIFMVMNGYGGLNTLLPILLVLIVAGLIGIFLKENAGPNGIRQKARYRRRQGHVLCAGLLMKPSRPCCPFYPNTLSYVRIRGVCSQPRSHDAGLL